MLEFFTELPTPLPPMLMEMMGVTVDSRYIALGYFGNKATWHDGRNSATFSFYSCYQPLIDHEAIAYFLWDAYLGSDEEFPTHLLLCDRTENKLYVGERHAIEKFLSQQHPPLQKIVLTPQEWKELQQKVETQVAASEDQMRRLGMFEMFGISKEQRREQIQLVHWLDAQVTEELVERYLQSAEAGNHQAATRLRQRREPPQPPALDIAADEKAN